jgi:hypothetical protein
MTKKGEKWSEQARRNNLRGRWPQYYEPKEGGLDVYIDDIAKPLHFDTLELAMRFVEGADLDATVFRGETLVASRNRAACDGAWMFAARSQP